MAAGKKIVVGNWKMHGAPGMARLLAAAVADFAANSGDIAEVILCPPAPLLAEVATALNGQPVKMGAQDCHAEAEGAYTGDVSAAMIKGLGCTYVIVGHSERRLYHRETNDDVRKKAARAIASGLIPIVCIGETASEREAGNAEAVIERQLAEGLPQSGQFMLAYEPIWAIGSGKTPMGGDIRRIHAHIASIVTRQTGLSRDGITILYGGSVSTTNARGILGNEGVDGVLVGGASLKAEEFCRIISAAA